MQIFSNLRIWLVYFLLAFPLFYFVYKYGTPDMGLRDFYDYYKLYSNWDISHVDAPFNMRLVSSYLVYLMNQAGMHYDTAIAFDKTGMDKQIFFNAVFFNFLCIVSTCLILYRTCLKNGVNSLLSFGAGLLYLLGFGTLFYEMMPLTDAFSILMFGVVLYYYLKKSAWIIVPLLVLILQREYIFMALGLLALIDYWKYRDRYYAIPFLASIACFAIYFVLRKTVFYTATYDHQASAGFFLDSLTKIKFPLIPYIKQTMMTLNLMILYVGIVVYKYIHKKDYDKFALLKVLALFLQINIISFVAVFGNNTGRYFYILVPLVIFEVIRESRTLFEK